MNEEILDPVSNATLSGYALMIVMLACFLVGALSMRLALEFDVKALWAAIRRNKPTKDKDDDAGDEA